MLTDTKLRNFKPEAKTYKVSDRDGLYVTVLTTGTVSFRYNYLPDILTVPQAQQIFMATRVLSYRVFFFTLYSLGLRLGEGLRLQVGDFDADRMRVQVRNAKGNRDHIVPLPENTLQVLCRFWQTHRNLVLMFPNRKCGLNKAHLMKQLAI